jgi:Zn-dependent protease
MPESFTWPPQWSTLLLLPALFVAFTVHELAHALVAFLLGDTSQVERNRLSWNPLRHVSWLGMLAFLLVGFGWAKPMVTDWTRFRIKNRALGMFLVSIAGSAANLLLAVAVLMGMTLTAMTVTAVNGTDPAEVLFFLMTHAPGPDELGVAVALSTYMVIVNLVLAFFNLLPLPPLDGFQALASLVSMVRNALRDDRQASQAEPSRTGEAVRSPAQIHLEIALAYHREGEWDEAIARYRQALEHDDRFALAYYNLGLAYLAKGRLPLATGAFRAAKKEAADVGVHLQAHRRLKELADLEQGGTVEARPIPPPLEPGAEIEVEGQNARALDPIIVRRLWLRLSLGGALALVLAVAAWLYVTAIALMAPIG